MLRKINILIALTLLIIGGLEAQNHSDKIIANLQKPASNSVLVVSHRADWRNAPENSIPTARLLNTPAKIPPESPRANRRT